MPFVERLQNKWILMQMHANLCKHGHDSGRGCGDWQTGNGLLRLAWVSHRRLLLFNTQTTPKTTAQYEDTDSAAHQSHEKFSPQNALVFSASRTHTYNAIYQYLLFHRRQYIMHLLTILLKEVWYLKDNKTAVDRWEADMMKKQRRILMDRRRKSIYPSGCH